MVDVFKADPILDFLEAEGISEVVLFLSHSDRDHILGVKDFLAEFRPPRSVLGILFNKDRIKAGVGSGYKSRLQFIGSVSKRELTGDARHLRADFNTNLNDTPRYERLLNPTSALASFTLRLTIRTASSTPTQTRRRASFCSSTSSRTAR